MWGWRVELGGCDWIRAEWKSDVGVELLDVYNDCGVEDRDGEECCLEGWCQLFLHDLHQQLQSHISNMQKRYSVSANKHLTLPLDFKIGDKVFIKSNNICTTWTSKKLTEKYLGPFEIIAQVGSISFTLHLPDSMRSIHPIFHVSMLEPSTPNEFPNWTPNPEPPIILDSNSEYKISEILDSHIDKWCKCKSLYLVKWAGYEGTDEETSWLPASKLRHASEIISNFHQAYPSKPGPLPLAESWCSLSLQQLVWKKKTFFSFHSLQ